MTKKKQTKRALLSSVMSIILCFTMLLGTTFAWFTDSATSGSNVITAGNLDIDVQYTLDGENWDDLDGATDLFQKGLWEPGHTEVVALKLSNKGSLALKYVANMNIVGETVGKTEDGKDIVLSDILTVSTLVQQANDAMGVGDITLGLAFSGENKVAYENNTIFKAANVLRTEKEMRPGDEYYMFVKVDMAETVGNEANHDGENVPAINFGINIIATQYNYEEDSFGNDYDVDAAYPETHEVTTIEEFNAAITNAEDDDTIRVMNDLSTTSLTVAKDVTIDLNGKTLTTDAWGGVLLKDGASLVNGTIEHKNAVAAIKVWNAGTIENVTINVTKETANNHITGIAVQQGESNGIGVIKNVTINGASQGIEVKWGSYVNLLENVEVNARTIGNNSGTALVVDGGKVGKAVNCEFSGEVYGVHMWLRGEYDVALELEKCKVSSTSEEQDKIALYAHDEPNIPNTTNCSLSLTYDADTEFEGNVVAEFEEECMSVVEINRPGTVTE